MANRAPSQFRLKGILSSCSIMFCVKTNQIVTLALFGWDATHVCLIALRHYAYLRATSTLSTIYAKHEFNGAPSLICTPNSSCIYLSIFRGGLNGLLSMQSDMVTCWCWNKWLSLLIRISKLALSLIRMYDQIYYCKITQ